MESVIEQNLQPEFAPVAVVWSNTIPDDTLQFKRGKFGCILYLFAEASLRGKVAGGNRESITCDGGRAALGLGADFDASDELLDRYAALFSKGLESFRAHSKITSHFIHPGFRPPWPDLRSQNPQNSLLFLRFCDRRSNQSDPNPGA